VWLCFFQWHFIDLFSCLAASLFNKLTYLLTSDRGADDGAPCHGTIDTVVNPPSECMYQSIMGTYSRTHTSHIVPLKLLSVADYMINFQGCRGNWISMPILTPYSQKTCGDPTKSPYPQPRNPPYPYAIPCAFSLDAF